MLDPQPAKRRHLSEISHLFLSGVRDRQTNNAPRPVRKPPARSDVSIDMTPQEFAQAAHAHPVEPDSATTPPRIAPLSAIIGSHLNGRQFDRVKEYARHLAAGGQRVGLIEVDASEFRLLCFEAASPHESAPAPGPVATTLESRQISEALYELNWDVDQWLLLLPNPRTVEARTLLRGVDHWTALSTCDHDGIVSCYRTLKGLSDLPAARLAIALLDAADADEAARVFKKLTGVCRQFLGWDVRSEDAVLPAPHVMEHDVLVYRPMHDKAQLAAAPHWDVVSQFLAAARASAPRPSTEAPAMTPSDTHPAAPRTLTELVIPTPAVAPAASPISSPAPAPQPLPTFTEPVAEPHPLRLSNPVAAEPVRSVASDVIDLPAMPIDNATLLSAVLAHASAGLVECPIRAPGNAEARLGVTRERRLVLLAMTGQGLAGLGKVGQAYQWLIENRALIAMAVPQLAIDPDQHPELRLFVDFADRSAELLQPMLQSANVTVQAYRKLTWHGRSGLLLEAA